MASSRYKPEDFPRIVKVDLSDNDVGYMLDIPIFDDDGIICGYASTALTKDFNHINWFIEEHSKNDEKLIRKCFILLSDHNNKINKK